MRPDAFSIRRRTLTVAIALLLVAASALIIFIRDYAERSADRAFDQLLGASALTIAGAVQAEPGTVTVELPVTAFAMFSGNDRVFYSISDADNLFVTGYTDLGAALPPAESGEARFDDIVYRDETVRVVTLGRLISTVRGTGWMTVRVAETRSERAALANEIFGNAIVPVIVLTLIALALVWVVLGRVFAPLADLQRHLQRRNSDNLAPIDLPVPVEVGQLVSALNDFMGRLEIARRRLEALVTEAAHEVRTPLASLRAQAELAREETDPVALNRQIGRIHAGAVHASQLVSQLLMDATVQHRLEFSEPGQTDLGHLLREVENRLDPDLADRLVIDACHGVFEASVSGDRLVLREMLRNLIDNAMTYSNGLVELNARIDGPRVLFEIRDRGPGIPDHEKREVLKRFARGRASEGKAGSGLGLPIVQRVVHSLNGLLQLRDRPGGGLVVRVELPLAARKIEASRGAFAAMAFTVLAVAAACVPRAEAADNRLTIVGTTDSPVLLPLIEAFEAAHPTIEVVYVENDTLPIYEDYRAGRLEPHPDILMSSAADLQLKLANDGYALRYDSPYLAGLPSWAHWRAEVFGFTYEPAVIVYDPDAFEPEEVPRTRIQLAELLEQEPERFRGKVATYDIETSGVGYLLAAQDGTISSLHWRLAAAFGRVDARLSGSSPAILTGVETGELSLAYNVLGSYALARQAEGGDIGIVVPDDYVLVLTRTMIIPRDAARPDLARIFIDFTLSARGQRVLAGPSALGAIDPNVDGELTARTIAAMGLGVVQPIVLGPSLLVSLDPQRRGRFLQAWNEIIAPSAPRPRSPN